MSIDIILLEFFMSCLLHFFLLVQRHTYYKVIKNDFQNVTKILADNRRYGAAHK